MIVAPDQTIIFGQMRQMIMIKTNNMEVANLKQCTAYTCKVSYPKVNGVGPHLDKLLWENYTDYNMTVLHTLI